MPLPRRFAYFNLLDLQDRGLARKTTRWKRQGRQFGWLIKDLCPRRLQVKRDLIRIRSNERFCGVRSSQGVNPKTYRSRKSHSQKIGRAPWFHWRFVAAMGIRTAMTLCYRGSLGCGELRGHGFPGLPNRFALSIRSFCGAEFRVSCQPKMPARGYAQKLARLRPGS